jgi:2-methylisocitrate lyase-like PEP mutase family enzyme
MTQHEKAEAFRALHEGEPFVFPNPWDAGSARMLEALGFKALATTSSGFAFTRGKLDGGVALDDVVDHVEVLCAVTSVPVAVDLENGHGPPDLAIERVAEAGAVGGSIEDYDGEGALYPLEVAVERVNEAVEAVRSLNFPFTFTARSENQLHGNKDLDETIERLRAFERAGADVLFAPGLRNAEEARRVCSAVSKPVNVLGHAGLTFAEIVEAGGQRASVGGALTWVAVAAAAEAAAKLREGDFSVLKVRVPLAEWLAD